jgi:transcriptional regulator GlxA family with amidase domain
MPLGGICTGSYLLAKAELLKGYRCTIHWEDLPTLQAHFPGIVISSQLFELDRDRYTCSGGVAAMDMMLQLVAREPGGQDIAAKAAELLLCDRVRGERERQRVPLRTLLGSAQPKLSQVVAIMEANLEEPLGLEELASLNEVTVRQLERLFHKYLQRTPSQYYLELRLSRAGVAAAQRRAGARGGAGLRVQLAGAFFQELQPVLWFVAVRERRQASLH